MGQPVVHFEVIGKDGEKLRDYYSELFGWEIDADNPMNYGTIEREKNLNDEGVGIGGGIAGGIGGDVPQHRAGRHGAGDDHPSAAIPAFDERAMRATLTAGEVVPDRPGGIGARRGHSQQAVLEPLAALRCGHLPPDA